MARKQANLVWILALVLVGGGCSCCLAFTPAHSNASRTRSRRTSIGVSRQNCNVRQSSLPMIPDPTEEADDATNLALGVDRRDFVLSAAGRVMTAAALATWSPSAALAASSNLGDSPDRPVAIIGAGGRTGMEVVQALAKQGIYSVTFTRTGNDPFRLVKLPPNLKPFVEHYEIPVALPSKDALQTAMTASHASALIYCASASKQGGTASQVDDLGVGVAAEVAQARKARLVVLSALAVDRPDSKSFQITNTIGGNFNGIMDAKRQGEDKVRQIMKKNYVILRPGFLLSGKGSGSAQDLELNQGDTIGGGLSRDELAQLAVAALQISNLDGVTVEAYRKKTATKLQPAFTIPSGRELSSDTYVGLFEKALADEAGMPYLPK